MPHSPVMTPKQFKLARRRLRKSAQKLADDLGVSSGRTIRYWETEGNKIPGPVAVAVRYMVDEVQ